MLLLTYLFCDIVLLNSKNGSAHTAPCFTCVSVCLHQHWVSAPLRRAEELRTRKKSAFQIRIRKAVGCGRHRTVAGRRPIGTVTVPRYRHSQLTTANSVISLYGLLCLDASSGLVCLVVFLTAAAFCIGVGHGSVFQTQSGPVHQLVGSIQSGWMFVYSPFSE